MSDSADKTDELYPIAVLIDELKVYIKSNHYVPEAPCLLYVA
jgi:hypothetical protein